MSCAGAQGIHVPRCNTAADLVALVKWTRFHPVGERTFYNRGRSGNFSVGVTDTAEWARAANRELLVIGMVEEVKALQHLDEMLPVPGVDAIHLGHMDLWQSMGMPPDMKGVFETIDKIAGPAPCCVQRVEPTAEYNRELDEAPTRCAIQ